MHKNPKLPNKDAVSKLRKVYNEITNTKINLEQKKEIEELIKKIKPVKSKRRV